MRRGDATVCEIESLQIFGPAPFEWFGCLQAIWIFSFLVLKRLIYVELEKTLKRRSTSSPVYGSIPVIGGSAYGIPLNA